MLSIYLGAFSSLCSGLPTSDVNLCSVACIPICDGGTSGKEVIKALSHEKLWYRKRTVCTEVKPAKVDFEESGIQSR
jgi:hypothetical protein